MKLIRPYRDDCRHLRLDDQDTLFFARQLEYVKSRTYDVLYSELSAFRLFPISTEAGPGAASLIYRSFDQVGQAKIISSWADDLPTVDAVGKEFPSPIRSIGAWYGWSLDDIRMARMAGVGLDTKKAMAAVRAHNQEINRIAWFGDEAYGLPGLATASDIPSQAAQNGGWTTADADSIVEDVNELLTSIISASSGVERANTVAMPSGEFAIASSARLSNTTQTAIGFLRANWPGVDFVPAEELAGWDSGDDAMIAFNRSEDKLSLEIPQPYEELPVQPKGLKFIVPTHSRCGGLLVYYPKSVAIRTGIQAAS